MGKKWILKFTLDLLLGPNIMIIDNEIVNITFIMVVLTIIGLFLGFILLKLQSE
jgi:hypothetical protein